MCRLRVSLSVGLSGCFALTPCPHTLSPRFVSLRFVSTLCPYASSSHRTRRSGATRIARRCRAGSGALSRSRSRSRPRAPVLPELPVLPVLPAGGQAPACQRTLGRADARPSRGCGPGVLLGAQHAASRDPTSPRLRRTGGFALPALARLCRSHPQCGADIPVCARSRGQRNVCPTLPRSIPAVSRNGFALPVLARFCRCVP